VTKQAKSSVISRFALSTALMAATVVLLAALFFHFLKGDLFQDSFSAPLEDWAGNVASRITADPELAAAVARNHNIGIIVSTEEGVTAYAPGGEEVDPETLMQHSDDFRMIEAAGHDQKIFTFFLDHNQISKPRYSLIGGFLALLLVIVGLVYYVQLSQLKPLRWLGEGVDAVSKGDFSTRVPVVRMDEIGHVGRAFNNMTQRVEQMINDHDRLMADVSHELRSPMARIKVALELMPESKMREEITRDVREMEALTTVLLERERVRNRADRLETETVKLVPLVQEVVEGFAGRKPGILFNDFPDEATAKVDPALIKVLVQNLADNAVKFSTPDSSNVELGVLVEGGTVILTVDDDGPGIPTKETERVLEPFVKLDPARGHRKGYGLGLNLCQRIVQAHGGKIEISALEGKGTRVKVTLPGPGRRA